MGRPKKLIDACSKTSELLMRMSALIMARTCSQKELDDVFLMSQDINNAMAIITNEEDIEGALEEFRGAFTEKRIQNKGLVSSAWIIVCALILEALSEARNWEDGGPVGNFNEKTYDKETSNLVDGILDEISEAVKEAEKNEQEEG